ncbi:hypothetical protein [Encephalitozoon cuniculi GB-M1]|uniref:UPF0329 protein ECU07_1860/ECU10_0040/ECU11_2100 n=1 Tax=Encephalitozoon cuniculi (strain GB-M1) TaxID=284813 RepID=Y7I6_ENCCU|nr:uncharacterized protein ECU07_1860 [Encephalitozoon cuniculi GB-M1]NP_586120.1 uncharacterized protein ECU10_0040 [Encephalitozoon cuniculi GB-M1]NP_586516.1 uncharacterized protein ECU11_2100 [Encephalitozoon cuniculi GB-M1]Q8ST89.1 RecName: Full=UPF0329 protein ECU07_1860/ECU10_0040/ECU11_2100 [Encephalitozoon cuniculi GB-M1]CAD25717.1 hypothetical protein [Encephalitozoon cuniculi GB-M1]CAD25724.1 hypothetical protein [Encephalitozoon cuniculi GB-M1]CAD26120.1 hypothetical protein [Ence
MDISCYGWGNPLLFGTCPATTFRCSPGIQVIVFPFLLKGHSIVGLPTAKFSDLKRKTKRGSLGVYDGQCGVQPDDRFERLFDERMGGCIFGSIKDIRQQKQDVCELLEMVYEEDSSGTEGGWADGKVWREDYKDG